MTETFHARIAALPDAELIRYLAHFQDYRTEAVAAALAELDRRGLPLPTEELARIRAGLAARTAAAEARRDRSLIAGLGHTLESRLARIRLIATGILAVGLSAGLVIFTLATPSAANPPGFNPEDSKKYLRDMEILGGKLNLLASQIRDAWAGLWQGRNLAFTVAALTVLLAVAFWLLATRRARDLDEARLDAAPLPPGPPRGDGDGPR